MPVDTGVPRRLRNGLALLSRAIEALGHGARAKAARHGLVGDPRLWKAKRRFQIDYLCSQGLERRHNLLDVGCGTLRGGIPLIDYLDRERYVGVEIRSNALAEGHRELAEARLEWKRPQLVHTDDLSMLCLDRHFDFVWAFSVLIHMTDKVLDGCFGLVRRHLAADGVFLANANIGDDGRSGMWEHFPVMRHPWSFYEKLAQRHGLTVENIGCLRNLGDPGTGCVDPTSRFMLRFRMQGK